MTPQQKIFKVIVLHNRLMAEGELDAFFEQTPDPEDVIAKMAIGEVINDAVADKLRSLYEHNLKKQGLSIEMGPDPDPPKHFAPKREVKAQDVPQPEAAPPPPRKEQHAEPHGPKPAEKAPSPEPAQLRAEVQSHFRAGDEDTELVLMLLRTAREMRASDLHLMAGAVPAVRIASVLHDLEMPAVSAETVEKALKSLLKPPQRKEFEEHSDLDCSFDGGPGLGRFRLNMLRQHRGVGGVFRLIPEKVPTFEELRLPEQMRKFTQYRQGVVLVTGPKGSGKTTTLAALIDLINTNRAEHIITIEDPIEFVHPSKRGHVNQREVGVHTRSFAAALRASLREAPDVIMVGEMRDLETVSLAITAAETGHLVFGTLHTPDSQRTVNRVIDVFPPKEQGQIRAMFSESLRGIVSQHLMPGMDGKSMHLATEILFNTSAIANLIRDNRAFQIHGIMQTHRKIGMHLMDDSLIKLVKEGKISREDALSRADNLGLVEKETGHDSHHHEVAKH
jgi:twitching motility protein PilT